MSNTPPGGNEYKDCGNAPRIKKQPGWDVGMMWTAPMNIGAVRSDREEQLTLNASFFLALSPLPDRLLPRVHPDILSAVLHF